MDPARAARPLRSGRPARLDPAGPPPVGNVHFGQRYVLGASADPAGTRGLTGRAAVLGLVVCALV